MQTVDKKYFLFNKGINTEAPLVGWPEGFTIDEQNFDLLIDGSRRRRPGLAPETTPPVIPDVPVVPPVITPPTTECFNLYTKAVDTTRVAADGRIIDPELQFNTSAYKAYWIYGRIYARQASAAGSPGIALNFGHTGTTTVFGTRGYKNAAFYTIDNSNAYWQPGNTSDILNYSFNTGAAVDTTSTFSAYFDTYLITGATGGAFGIYWGLNNLAALGSTTLLIGSYFTAIEITLA